MKNRMLLALLLVVASTAVFADQPNCVRSENNARIEWQGNVPEDASVRVYFRAANAKAEHYVDMAQAPSGAYWTLLPKAANDAVAVEYRIATVVAGKETTQTKKTLIVSPQCNPAKLTVAEARATGRIVVGATEMAPSFPIGFRCEGVVGRISADGVLVTERACAEVTAATAGLVVDPTATAPATTATNNATAARPATAGARNEAALSDDVSSEFHRYRGRKRPARTPPNRRPRNPNPNPPSEQVSTKR